ncbi:exodeoxyribonuclease VII large subunit [Marinobacter xestospongiae]|uniref:Exodeoxyribonuclease 7 large subunit n=1 Tax=Marinobacter xestospongiae TaxID=994319 RepID=A0ABU3VXV2_9GAMM|nr:exodeoxyribonuclease VII large subunit [Marinobacter xestospongiae]MDV2079107.1 exodeoxyribonuclease VII large subunit [Marinobacter xestospongiae]
MDTPTLTTRPRALTVSELNHQVRHLLETSFMQAWIEGELSSLSRPSSGHWYFTLKDSRCQVRCAMFRGFNQRLRQIPRDGDQVRLRGKVSLYENRGDFQIIVEHMEPAGQGSLQQAFEALKAKLSQEGLFDADRKRPIPFPPRHIGVVTSPTGAAIHDILTVLARRCPAIPVTLYPTAVQGQAATDDIVAALNAAQAHNQADVLIVGRGGGSLEDLWCFNEERVARALANCRIPTVSAVGHEVDVTIADFVADLRAPTPSAAAEKVSPDQQQWLMRLDEHQQRLQHAARRTIQRQRQQLAHLAARLRDPRRELQDKAQRLDELELRFQSAIRQRAERDQVRLQNLGQRLKGRSPLQQVSQKHRDVEQLNQRLRQAFGQRLDHARDRLGHLGQTLHVVSPLATLGRGYAIVQDPQERIIRNPGDLSPGDQIHARLAHGSVSAVVTATHAPEAPEAPSDSP